MTTDTRTTLDAALAALRKFELERAELGYAGLRDKELADIHRQRHALTKAMWAAYDAHVVDQQPQAGRDGEVERITAERDYLSAWMNRIADEMEAVGVALDDGRVWARKLRAAAQRRPGYDARNEPVKLRGGAHWGRRHPEAGRYILPGLDGVWRMMGLSTRGGAADGKAELHMIREDGQDWL